MCLISGSERSPEERNGPTPVSCLGNPMDREVWWATVHGVAKESNTTEQVNNNNNWPESLVKCQREVMSHRSLLLVMVECGSQCQAQSQMKRFSLLSNNFSFNSFHSKHRALIFYRKTWAVNKD